VGGRQPLATRVMASIAVVLVAAAVGVGVWTLGHHGGTPHANNSPSHSPTPTHPALSILKPASAVAFGPSANGGNSGDNPTQAPLAIDGNPSTDWYTDSYQGSARFGNLYNGTGLMLNMGKKVNVSSVTVQFGTVPGAHVRIEVGNNDTGTVPAGATTLGHSGNAVNTIKFSGQSAVSGQFVFIWFTKLAPQQGQSGHFQADVFNVVVRGSP
jgi:hypothetical protein